MHKWSGVRDGRFSSGRLHHLIMHDQDYSSSRDNIISCQLLIVDEISMISLHLITLIDIIMRRVRNDDRPFGGVQVIFAGDFYQLAPVPNILYGDSGSFCIESSLFNRLHHFNLTHVHRQKDPKFINIIREVSTGYLTDESVRYLDELSFSSQNIPLKFQSSVRLVGTNFECDYLNAMMLYHLPGSFKMFKSTDIGSPKELIGILAPSELYMKTRCPVMVLRNLSHSVVNGMRGIAYELGDDVIRVQLEDNRIIGK